MLNLKSIFIFLFTLSAVFISAQSPIGNEDEIKLQIEKFSRENNIQAINRLINQNLSLDPKYTFEILTQNLKYAKQKGNAKSLANTYFTLGNFWHVLGNKSKAYENYLECESAGKNNLEILGVCLRNRATLMTDNGAKIQVLQKAIFTFEKTKDTLNLAISHLNTGIAYSSFVKLGDSAIYQSQEEVSRYKKNAFKHYGIAQKLNQQLKKDELSAGLLTYYAEWFLYEKNLSKARDAYQQSKELIAKTSNKKGYVNTLLELARIDIDEKKYDSAITLLLEAESLSKNFQFNDQLVKIYNEYTILYDSIDDKKKALEYARLYAQQALMVNNTNNDDKIQIVSLEHDLAENDLKIEKFEAQTKLNQIFIVLIILGAIFIAGISYLVLKNNRRKIENLEKNKIITEIQLKNQQLEDELLREKVGYTQNHLVTVANLSNKILVFLDELKIQVKELSHNSTYQQGINDLRVSFSKILNDKSYLTELNSLSSELNQDFFIHIRKKYPEVTPKDEQLLSFIILNMTSKEIGKALNISTESVYIKRHRLRKKLMLEANDSIPKFYKKSIKNLSS